MLQTFGRLFVVLIAILISAIIAGFSHQTLTTVWVNNMQIKEPTEFALSFAQKILPFLIYIPVGGIFLIVPSILIALFGETMQIRSFFYYFIGGGIALMAFPLLTMTGFIDLQIPDVFSPKNLGTFFASGLSMGLIYWLLAGRKA